MGDATSQTIYFYDRHPISCDIILAKLRASRGHLEGLRPNELFAHDQDHYGGNWPEGRRSGMDRALPISARGLVARCDTSRTDMVPTSLVLN